ncbi:MAG: hypothetical protein Tsb0034_13570 [Ekhidna sp.]
MIAVPILGFAQLGGQASFQALNLSTNPRAAALGGSAISLGDGDLSQFFENPSIIDSVESDDIFFHFNPYFADVFVYSLAYSFDIGKMEGFAAGINYVNFGTFKLTDETGAELGDFRATDFVVTMSKAHKLGPFTLGASIKVADSRIDTYHATALLFDLGGVFRINKHWTVGMIFENAGFRLSSYTGLEVPTIPFDVKVGTSFKPEYMPLRFSITSTSIVNDNVSEPQEESGRSSEIIDDVLKRINLGAEILLSEHFQLLVGYNHKRKQELRLDDTEGGAGFSYGLMVKIKEIQLRFSRATYHAAGGSSFMSIQTNLKAAKQIL